MKTMSPEVYSALNDLIEIRATLKLHGWMLATILALNITLLWKVFSL